MSLYVCVRVCSRFLHEVVECSSQNKMNIMNLGTVLGPHLLSPQTNDPMILMECNSISTDFVRAMVTNHSSLFPPTNDESTPRRLSVVFQPENMPPWLQVDQDAEKLYRLGGQRSLYRPPKDTIEQFKHRQNTLPVKKGRGVYPSHSACVCVCVVWVG